MVHIKIDQLRKQKNAFIKCQMSEHKEINVFTLVTTPTAGGGNKHHNFVAVLLRKILLPFKEGFVGANVFTEIMIFLTTNHKF